jgi:hypothetical protein
MQIPGLAPPQVPQNREQLQRLLIRAGQLEHVLLCAYLFTGYSLKQDPDEGGIDTAEQLTATQAWKSMIIGVAVQEMLHLSLASNLLTAVGGKPNFSRRALPPEQKRMMLGMDLDLEFPISPAQMTRAFGYPATSGAWLGLWPFADADRKATAIERFVWYESYEDNPELAFPGPPWAARGEVEAVVPGHLAGLEELEISTLVELYKAIGAGFVHLEKKLGHGGLFCGDMHRQVTEQEMTGLFNFPPATVERGGKTLNAPLLITVHDVPSALMAVNTIIVQGEGDTDDWKAFLDELAPGVSKTFPTINSPPHHRVFQGILDGVPAHGSSPRIPGYPELAKKYPHFAPVRDLPENPLAQDTCHGDPVCRRHVHLVDGYPGQLAGYFDGLYNLLIDTLALSYTFDSDSGDLGVQGYEKATLVQASVRSMVYLMAPLGNALAQMGAGPGFIYREHYGGWDDVVSGLLQNARRAKELGTLAPKLELWLTPAYLAVPPKGHAYPRGTLADLLSNMLAPDLLYMADRLRRVRGHKPPVGVDGELYEQHVCQGLNACKGQDITGRAPRAGEGLCATADPHVCSGQNHCKAQGGCGFSPDANESAAEARQNHPGRNLYAGLVEPDPKAYPDQTYFVSNPDADSACGSPILPSLQNTFGENTDPAVERGGDAEVYAAARGFVWDFARRLFEERCGDLEPGAFRGEDGRGIDRYR